MRTFDSRDEGGGGVNDNNHVSVVKVMPKGGPF
jgi:hypothetical protein